MNDLPAWTQLVIGIAAVLVALGTIYRWVWPALQGLARGVRVAWRVYQGTRDFVEDLQQTGGFSVLAGQVQDLKDEIGAVRTLAQRSHHALHPNGGTSMRDGVDRIERTTVELRGYAEANRSGIEDLRDQTNDLGRRLTDVDEKAEALGARQEALRSADQQFARELQHYIDTEHRDLVAGNEALRSALNEVLAIDEEQLP